jgi:hypothetical protein
VKFADAKPSQLADLRKGDQVRARGDKTPDGSEMTADEIVSGQFRLRCQQPNFSYETFAVDVERWR